MHPKNPENPQDNCCLLAGARIAMTIPMTAEAVVAYLGIVLAGCAVVAIADSFSAAEIASRLRIGGATAIITQVRYFCTLAAGYVAWKASPVVSSLLM